MDSGSHFPAGCCNLIEALLCDLFRFLDFFLLLGLLLSFSLAGLVEVHERERNILPPRPFDAVITDAVAFRFIFLNELVGAVLEVKLDDRLSSERKGGEHRPEDGKETCAFGCHRTHCVPLELDAHSPPAAVLSPALPRWVWTQGSAFRAELISRMMLGMVFDERPADGVPRGFCPGLCSGRRLQVVWLVVTVPSLLVAGGRPA